MSSLRNLDIEHELPLTETKNVSFNQDSVKLKFTDNMVLPLKNMDVNAQISEWNN